jgi:hypothetical protein
MFLLAAFVAILVVAVVSWGFVIVYALKAVRHTRTGVRMWSRATLWNPANVILQPELLTEEGLLYRRKCLRALLVFTTSVAIPLAIRTIAAALK